MAVSVPMRRRVRLAHRWLGLLVGLQLLMWVSGGLIMSAFDIQTVRGEHRVRDVPAPALGTDIDYRPPAELIAAHPGGAVTALRLTHLLGRPVYEVHGEGGVALVDAASGHALSPVARETAVAVARADYSGAADVRRVDWIDQEALEYRGRDLPLWRVEFGDELDTTLYVSAATGRVVARRNAIWRLFDFVWMLHIMDYDERDDFNNPLLVAFAATALAFVVSGAFMLALSFRRR